MKTRDFRKASICIGKTLEFLPDNTFLLEKAAKTHLLNHNDASAKKIYRILTKRSLNSLQYRSGLIQSLYNCGEYAETLKEYEEYLALAGKDPQREIMLLAGLSLLKLGRYQEAQEQLAKIPGKEDLPTFQEVLKRVPKPEVIRKKIKENTYTESLSDVRLELGFSYLFHGHYELARELFSKLLEEKMQEISSRPQASNA